MIPEFNGILSRSQDLDDCSETRAHFMYRYCGITSQILLLNQKRWERRVNREWILIKELFDLIEEDENALAKRCKEDPVKYELTLDALREMADRAIHQRDICGFAVHRMEAVLKNADVKTREVCA